MGNSNSIVSNPPKTVIIIGGGMAAKELAPFFENNIGVNLIVIEKRNAYQHPVGGLRGLVSPGYENRIVLNYDKWLDVKKGSRLVTGEACDIRKGGEENNQFVITTDSGENIIGDSVILATGAGQNQLGKTGDGLFTDVQMKAYFKNYQEKIAKAKKVVIIGGGPVGVEMAGELKHFNPFVEVTIVHRGAALCSNAASFATKKFQYHLIKIVEKSNTKVLLNDSVIESDSMFAESWIKEGPISFKTKAGTAFTNVDFVFRAVGVPGPTGILLNSEIFKKGKSIDDKGYFLVDDHFQVAGIPGLFSIGDCLTFPNEPKTVMSVMNRQPIVQANIISYLNGKPLGKTAKPAKTAALFVPFGPKDGAGYFGTMSIFKPLVVMAKSKDLFVSPAWQQINHGKAPE